MFTYIQEALAIQGHSAVLVGLDILEPIDTFPDRLKNEIMRLNLEEYIPVIPRNLNAIFNQF